jgi:integrase
MYEDHLSDAIPEELWNPQSAALQGELRRVRTEMRHERSPVRRTRRRDTFGTRWLQAGSDIYKLSKILGHSSVAVTEAHYAHLPKETWWPQASR